MVKRRVIFRKDLGKTFGKFLLPNDMEALVVDKDTHEKALRAAERKLVSVLQDIKIKRKQHGGSEKTAA